MKTHLLISSPNGEMKSTYVCPQVNLKIGEIDFQADLVIITSSGIDLILGMDWLGKHDGIILCAKKSVPLTSPKGDRIEFVATASPKKKENVTPKNFNYCSIKFCLATNACLRILKALFNFYRHLINFS
jgi:hypothetical protein